MSKGFRPLETEGHSEIFAKRFAALRKSKGLSQKAIADKLGITDRAVSKWETGRGTPKFNHIPVLASLFNVTIDYLFGCEKSI